MLSMTGRLKSSMQSILVIVKWVEEWTSTRVAKITTIMFRVACKGKNLNVSGTMISSPTTDLTIRTATTSLVIGSKIVITTWTDSTQGTIGEVIGKCMVTVITGTSTTITPRETSRAGNITSWSKIIKEITCTGIKIRVTCAGATVGLTSNAKTIKTSRVLTKADKTSNSILTMVINATTTIVTTVIKTGHIAPGADPVTETLLSWVTETRTKSWKV